MTDRRTFLKQAGLLAAALPLGASLTAPAAVAAVPTASRDKWAQLRQLFEQDPQAIHFANFLVTLFETEQPRGVLVAWDTPDAPNFRVGLRLRVLGQVLRRVPGPVGGRAARAAVWREWAGV